ncbi:MAG: undecaprenyldiphospho-muramoylpentapeptide beta-N-acetylglucosaminyltransferase [Acidimicrobiaceae bacterium]|nr:undecaprenyldiphospho-muramoylpentapeptide beta-N-acetylglucosaminyltransferase [Acidimicrobiaceae bacterium]MXW75519.1 undecaprenyldiphospho-muramoylpentapeptide beta-N-acetylglucosaminyltransferase [Acidimicrobiaceae bacterium]MYC42205.1 undecaprenyldiphospho-muramoylpentapeptide beta-N-acetylglucosaminyltransferase [Acidimicrobiaceae bacterium]MYD05899.1 undecaprenyldiphospho-muramoylpentapeptide beta-N-acetylglucosaminyltransferase [Acidimicrobiaceae bacterium]MYH87800.1 undecaprenyldiph
MTSSGRVWAVVAGGGTGGHVVPGLAIAEEIVSRCKRTDAVHYVGSRRGIETKMVPEAGFTLTALRGRGIARKLTLRNVGAVVGLCTAILEAIVRMARWRPAVVVGVGGFASVPAVVAAVVWRVPVVVAEQNAVPSAANRLGARFAKAAAVPFPDVDLPRAVWTGNPVRAEMGNVDRTAHRGAACQRLNVDPSRKLLCVFGGSLGARRINEALFATLGEWRGRDDLTIRHITGERDYAELKARVAARSAPETDSSMTPDEALRADDDLVFQLVEFEHDMASVYTASDLVLCRAGASTVAELTIAGVPAILVPLPGAPGDHQTANARTLAQSDAAKVVPDSELDGERLRLEVDALLGDEPRLVSMSAAAKAQGRPDAAEAVVDLLERHAKRPLEKPSET